MKEGKSTKEGQDCFRVVAREKKEKKKGGSMCLRKKSSLACAIGKKKRKSASTHLLMALGPFTRKKEKTGTACPHSGGDASMGEKGKKKGGARAVASWPGSKEKRRSVVTIKSERTKGERIRQCRRKEKELRIPYPGSVDGEEGKKLAGGSRSVPVTFLRR